MITTTHTIGGIRIEPGVFIGSTEQVLGRTIHLGGRCDTVPAQWTPVVRQGSQVLWEGEVQSSQGAAERLARQRMDLVLDRAVADLFK